jgi:CheY-like chemotaxis protein
MQNLIRWIRSVEMLASHIYAEASDRLRKDQAFSAFLQRLSDDEFWHYHILGDAAQNLQKIGLNPRSAVKLDSFLKNDVELPFKELNEMITRKQVHRRDILTCIARAEFSEWNSLFVYVINTLREHSPQFQHVAATIDSHKDRILKFLSDFSQEMNISMSVWNLPKIWDRKILVIEDELSVRGLIASVLETKGDVEFAGDGQEGLAKISDGFYNVVVSDIQMEGMSGLEMYKKAVAEYPKISRQFVFTPAEMTPELTEFFRENHLSYIAKPFSIRKLTHVVQEMIDKTL